MSLYQKIKSAITVRQVGEMYGMEPDRHGMVCCPFHSDSDPSMKLNDNYYYCFGCGANGDAIDLPPNSKTSNRCMHYTLKSLQQRLQSSIKYTSLKPLLYHLSIRIFAISYHAPYYPRLYGHFQFY